MKESAFGTAKRTLIRNPKTLDRNKSFVLWVLEPESSSKEYE